jgi:hypothetical protein
MVYIGVEKVWGLLFHSVVVAFRDSHPIRDVTMGDGGDPENFLLVHNE